MQQQTNGFIDLHSHILPGFDDGPETVDESLAMAHAYVRTGFTKVVATPHIIPGLYDHTRLNIIEGVHALQKLLDKSGIPLTVLPGAECHLTNRLLPMVQAGELVTLNDTGKYLLVELPVQEVPAYTQQALFELLLLGITPVIAHPERNGVLSVKPDILTELIQNGALAQVTAGSVTGLFGATAKRAAHLFINRGIAQFIATDAHSPGLRLAAGTEAARVLGSKGIAMMREQATAVAIGAQIECTLSNENPLSRKSWTKVLFRRKKFLK